MPKPPGHVGAGDDEHVLADEMVEGLGDVLVCGWLLLHRQLDVEADGTPLPNALFAASMMPGPPPEITENRNRKGAARNPLQPCRNTGEPAPRGRCRDRNRRAHAGKPLGRLDELCHNPEDPPGSRAGSPARADKGSAIFGNLSFASSLPSASSRRRRSSYLYRAVSRFARSARNSGEDRPARWLWRHPTCCAAP